jgi:branched-chain amino acid aminotransferase
MQNLSFGQHFSDHWFSSRFTSSGGWVDAKVEPYGPISLDPAASVLHYGQALFEGMKAFRQKDGAIAVFRPEFNCQRMQYGAERLCLEAPPAALFLPGLKALLEVDERWVPHADSCSLYIRPTLIGTEAFLGVRPSREILFYILLSPVGSYFNSSGSPLKIWVEEKDLRAAPGGLGSTKAGANYAASLRAARAAKQNGFDQVLWLDIKHEGIEEVGTMNVFFVLKNEVVTPELNGSILAGGMRDSTIQLLRHMGIAVSERHFTINELLEHHSKGELKEAFGTGTAAVISPIGELHYQGKSIVIGRETGNLSQLLFETIKGIQFGTQPDPFGWMKRIEDLA